jgi:hypothetical protein
MELMLRAFYQSGHAFTQSCDGVTSQLARLFEQYGIRNVQTRTCDVEYPVGTPEGQQFYEDTKRAFRTMVPFLKKWLRVPDDYEKLYQQALDEMQQPGFTATWSLLTVWGEVGG